MAIDFSKFIGHSVVIWWPESEIHWSWESGHCILKDLDKTKKLNVLSVCVLNNININR